MIDQTLEEFVSSAREGGMTDDAIRIALSEAGENDDAIDAVLSGVHSVSATSVASSPQPNQAAQPSQQVKNSGKSPKKLKIAIIAVVLIFLFAAGGVWAYTVFISQPTEETTEETAPYSTETFLSDLTSSLKNISSATYRVAIALKTGRRSLKAQSLRDAFPEFIPDYNLDLDSKLVEPLITQMIRSEDTFSALLPTELEADIAVEGNIQENVGVDSKLEGHTGITFSFATPDFSMNADVEFLAYDGTYYVRINRMPPILFFNFDKVKGQWIKISEDSGSISTPLTYTGPEFNTAERVKLLKAIKEIPKIADETKLFNVVLGEPLVDFSPEGDTSYPYELTLDAERLRNFFDSAMPVIRNALPEEQLVDFDEFVNKTRIAMSDPMFINLMKHLQQQSSLTIWVSEELKFPTRASLSWIFVPSVSEEVGSTNSDAAYQYVIDFSVSLSEINETVAVSAPEDFITLEEAFELVEDKPPIVF